MGIKYSAQQQINKQIKSIILLGLYAELWSEMKLSMLLYSDCRQQCANSKSFSIAAATNKNVRMQTKLRKKLPTGKNHYEWQNETVF